MLINNHLKIILVDCNIYQRADQFLICFLLQNAFFKDYLMQFYIIVIIIRYVKTLLLYILFTETN